MKKKEKKNPLWDSGGSGKRVVPEKLSPASFEMLE